MALFGFGSRKSSDAREALRADFFGIMSKMKSAPEPSRIAVCAAVEMAVDIFRSRYPHFEDFVSQSPSTQSAYMDSLRKAEQTFLRNKQHIEAVGFSLFLMWVGAVAARDAKLTEEFTAELYQAGVSKISDIFEQS